jgi:hypothetical protein
MEAEFEASWPSLSTVERQHALTAFAQAKQLEVLLSSHVVQPEDALDHKHNLACCLDRAGRAYQQPQDRRELIQAERAKKPLRRD